MENDRTTAASLRVSDRGSCGFLADDAADPHSHFSPIRSTLASMFFLRDETTVIGIDHGSPVPDRFSDSYGSCSGEIQWAQIEPAADGRDHFIAAEDRLKLAMARQ